jgi:hypothetical protein
MPVLFLRKVTLELCHITERIGVMLADDASPGSMDGEDLDTKTADELTALPRLLQRLRRRAWAGIRACSCPQSADLGNRWKALEVHRPRG